MRGGRTAPRPMAFSRPKGRLLAKGENAAVLNPANAARNEAQLTPATAAGEAGDVDEAARVQHILTEGEDGALELLFGVCRPEDEKFEHIGGKTSRIFDFRTIKAINPPGL